MKLGDFGLASLRPHSRLTVEGMIVGTVAYMAPKTMTDTLLKMVKLDISALEKAYRS